MLFLFIFINPTVNYFLVWNNYNNLKVQQSIKILDLWCLNLTFMWFLCIFQFCIYIIIYEHVFKTFRIIRCDCHVRLKYYFGRCNFYLVLKRIFPYLYFLLKRSKKRIFENWKVSVLRPSKSCSGHFLYIVVLHLLRVNFRSFCWFCMSAVWLLVLYALFFVLLCLTQYEYLVCPFFFQ